MGTGMVAILLHDLSYNAPWVYWLSVAVFVFDIVLFVLFLAASLFHYLVWPGSWTAIIHHPEQRFFLGAVPISLGMIISMICYVCVDIWGKPGRYITTILWAIEAVLSLTCALFMPFLLISRVDDIDLSKVTALHLFPAVSCVVASASGSVVASILTNSQYAFWIVLMSYVLWGIGMSMATMILVIYFHRLIIHKLPPREVMVSVFIPIGKLRFHWFTPNATHRQDQVRWVKVALQ